MVENGRISTTRPRTGAQPGTRAGSTPRPNGVLSNQEIARRQSELRSFGTPDLSAVRDRVAARADGAGSEAILNQLLRARVSPFHRFIGATSRVNSAIGTGSISSAVNGTADVAMERALEQATPGQRREIDARLRAGLVQDENGDRVQFDDGLAGLIRSEVGGPRLERMLGMLRR